MIVDDGLGPLVRRDGHGKADDGRKMAGHGGFLANKKCVNHPKCVTANYFDSGRLLDDANGTNRETKSRAARYGIDRLKEIVPVWKKEVGPNGEEWIEGDYVPKAGE